MTPEEIGQLLGVCATFDNRTVDEADIIAWQEILGDRITLPAARARVLMHYRETRDRIMPADILHRKYREEIRPADEFMFRQ